MREINTIEPRELDERQEGVIDIGADSLSIDLDDKDIVQIIGKRVEESEEWWNKELKLDKVREEAEQYYLNNTYDEKQLYEWQVPYKNNRIFTSVETLIPLVLSQPAEPVVTEARDEDSSRQLAMDLESVLHALYEDLYIKNSLSMVVRHLLIGKRIGVVKYRFDPSQGELLPNGDHKGKIVVEVVRPEKLVVEKESRDKNNIALIAEYMDATIEELINKFPDKKDEIFKKQGIKQGTKKQLQTKIGYLEVWFSYFDNEGNVQECVAWKWGDLILDKMKNPNWNYDEIDTDTENNGIRLNFLDSPRKPYIFFNHTNTGKYMIDDTSQIDQAMGLQDILNKRGKQIVENADQATGGLIFNEDMISQEDAKKVIGDPSEKVMVGGRVDHAATRLPYNPLPNYVIEDKFDARAEIDNIFGTNAPIRGEQSGLKTLGETILSQRANMGRLQTLADSIEDGMDELYKALVQMMKVYWDEPEILRFNQVEGKTQFLEWNRDKIEDGVQVRVKSGSALPKDKFSQRNEAIQLQQRLDPLTFYEMMDYPQPKEAAKREIYFRYFMDKYLALIEEGENEMDSKALADIQSLLSGETPEIPDEISQEYLLTMDKFIKSEGFQNLEDEQIKQNIVDFVTQVNNKAKEDIGEAPESSQTEPVTNEETPAPPQAQPEEPQPTGESPGGNILQRVLTGLRNRIGGSQ